MAAAQVERTSGQALVNAAARGDKEAVSSLARAGAPLDATDGQGDTALTLAAALGRWDIVGLLLDAGSDIDHKNLRAERAITHAAAQGHDQIVAALWAGSEGGTSFDMQLGAEDTLAFVAPLGQGEQAYYLATVSRNAELALLRGIQRTTAIIAAISLAVTIFFALVFGRTFSRPILRLVGGMNKVKMGDLDVSLEATTRDEIGLLTTTFNEMIGGLRERLHLRKYVGKHTIEMIQDAGTGDVNLGGHRGETAVLFSDVRGFTSFSEKRTPEEVISQINRYLGFQADIVADFNGSVDKFVGDEMMALWTGDDAVEQALQCAIAIQKRVEEEQRTDPQPFGTYAARTYSDVNPVIGAPLIYAYHTGAQGSAVPADASEQLAHRSIDTGFQDRGLPCLYDACWANGAVVFGALPTDELSAIEYAFGATTATVSNPKSASNGALGYVGRVGVLGGDHRFDLLRVGLSASYGPYLEGGATGVSPETLTAYHQIVVGTDISLKWRQVRFYLEAIRNWWQVPHLAEGTLSL